MPCMFTKGQQQPVKLMTHLEGTGNSYASCSLICYGSFLRNTRLNSIRAID